LGQPHWFSVLYCLTILGEDPLDRFIVVRHNYVRREHTTTKSKKSRRVDLSRELRKVLLELRDRRLLEAFLQGKDDISGDLVFPSPGGTILDPDNLYHRYFQKRVFRSITI
jgi:integrase